MQFAMPRHKLHNCEKATSSYQQHASYCETCSLSLSHKYMFTRVNSFTFIIVEFAAQLEESLIHYPDLFLFSELQNRTD